MEIVYQEFPKKLENVKFIKLENTIYINLSFAFENSEIEYSPLVPVR
jgi:hypothetical protein